MQGYKIKRMSNKRINESLKDIKFLLSHYERNKKVKSCPLCVSASCLQCLWEIIEGKDCFSLKYELGIKQDMTKARNQKKWHKARIPMLRRWKKILKIELARREQ